MIITNEMKMEGIAMDTITIEGHDWHGVTIEGHDFVVVKVLVGGDEYPAVWEPYGWSYYVKSLDYAFKDTEDGRADYKCSICSFMEGDRSNVERAVAHWVSCARAAADVLL